jgi:uracil phosphoribosyltransferase
LDPALATGGTAAMAVDSLIENGVHEENIIFICMVAVPEGVKFLCSKFPKV